MKKQVLFKSGMWINHPSLWNILFLNKDYNLMCDFEKSIVVIDNDNKNISRNGQFCNWKLHKLT